MKLAEQVPEIGEAIRLEQFERASAFLEFPEKVCGVWLRPLTLIDFIRLQAINSPFIVGGVADEFDAIAFLKLQAARLQWFTLKLAGVRHTPSELVASVALFIDDAFIDSPPTSDPVQDVQYWGVANDLIHKFGDAYGWAFDDFCDKPLKVLFTQLNVIRRATNPDAILFNPRSDKARGEWLRRKNHGTDTGRNQN